MANHVQEAFRRAAMRGAPMWRRFDVFAYPDNPTSRQRQEPNARLHWMFCAPGALKWQDTDEPGQEIREAQPYDVERFNNAGRVIAHERGLIIAQVFTEYDGAQTPDYLRDESGFFYRAKTLLGRDILNAGLRLQCRRRYGQPPEIATDAP